MSLTTAMWIGGFGAVLLISVGGFITLANRGSETVVLGFSALLSAFALFSVQLFFQLRGSTSDDAVGTQVLVNSTTRSVSALQPANKMRAGVEEAAGKWLAEQTESPLPSGSKVARDLLVFSILNQLGLEEQDWTARRQQYVFPAFGSKSSMTEFQRETREQATAVMETDIRAMLRVGNNLFAESPLNIPANGLRLPRGTRLELREAAAPSQRTTLTIRNAISTIDFVITPATMQEGMHPPTPEQKAFAIGQWVLKGMPDAEYSIYMMRILMQASFASLYAHHPDLERHKAWAARIQHGVGNWFKSEG